MTASTDMQVVLLDESGAPVGVAPKAGTHHSNTPLHLAFSCHVFDARGQVLITRRSLGKITWPGVWTNAFCGHPRPGEPIPEAVARHGRSELGLDLTEVRMVLPDFRYRATDASGVVENEVCPVYLATAIGQVQPHPDEVMDYVWVDPGELGESIRLTPAVFSPWLVLQARQLPLLGGKQPQPGRPEAFTQAGPRR